MLTNQFSGLNWQPLLSLFFILLLIGAYYFVHEFIVSIFQSTTIIQTSDSHQTSSTVIKRSFTERFWTLCSISSPFGIHHSKISEWTRLCYIRLIRFFKKSIQKTKGRFVITYTTSYSFWSLKSINIWFLIFKILINCI